MPTVFRLDSIKIDLYSRDHLPPHMHVLYGEHEALLIISSLEIYAGSLPVKPLRMVRKWASDSVIKKRLLETFYSLNPNLRK